MKLISTIISIMCTLSLYAQQSQYTISGYVRDSISGEPLIGVAIIDNQMRGTTTNTYGFYSLSVKANTNIELSFSYMGYKDVKHQVKLTKDTNIDLFLSQKSIVLDDVLVVSNRPKQVSVSNLGSISIDSKQLKFIPSFLGEQDILKYFQLQPGVSSGKEGSSGLNLRGGSADQTLILIDDIPIYNHSHAFGFISIFSGDYIKSAELYKGYVPPRYGGRLSGVATMNIREGNRNEHKKSLQVGTTTFSGLIEGPISKGNGSYLVGARYFVPHLFLRLAAVPLAKRSISVPIIGFYDVTAKVSYDLNSRNTIYASFYTGRDAFKFIDIETDHSLSDGSVLSNYRSEIGLNWGNIVGSIRLSSQLSNKLFLNTTTYYSYLSNQSNSTLEEEVENLTQNTRIESQMGEFGIKMHFQQNVNRWYYLSYGLNFSHQHFIPQHITLELDNYKTYKEYGTRNLLNVGSFLDNKFSFGKFNLNLGGRLSLHNNNSENKIAFEPRIALTYLMPKSSLWISYVQNTQPLFSMKQQSMQLPIDYWIPFQDSDKLPESQQLSLGYKYTFNFGLDILTETYYKKSNNIAFVFNDDELLLGEGGYNLAKVNAYGVELMAQYRQRKLSLMLSYSYSNSEYDIDGKTFDFMYDTPHNLNIFASYEALRIDNRVHTLSINANYKTGLPYIIANDVYPTEDPFYDWNDFATITNNPLYTNKRLNNFFRVDLNYTMEKRLERGSRIWQVSLLNATAHRNPYVVYSKSKTNSSSAQKYKAISIIPFLPSFSYTRKF